jgi:hypothetical protein
LCDIENNTGSSLEQSLLENGIKSSASEPIGNKESQQEMLPIFFNTYYFSKCFHLYHVENDNDNSSSEAHPKSSMMIRVFAVDLEISIFV